MAEDTVIVDGDKAALYSNLIPQIIALVGGERDAVANMSNIAAAIKGSFGFFWVGFYLVKNEELVLGPFQGPIACTRIQKGRGVCGTAWETKQTIIVDDVTTFPGHIACSARSKSEIVVPLIKNNDVIGVLDIDSDALATFDATDAQNLNRLCEWLVSVI